MTVTIYHNPGCGTSRNALAMIRQSGEEPNIIEYLQTPPSRREVAALAEKIGVPLRALLRDKGTLHAQLGLADKSLSEEALLDAMEAHPILLNRPIVVTERRARLCRASEVVLEILPVGSVGSFTKEDG